MNVHINISEFKETDIEKLLQDVLKGNKEIILKLNKIMAKQEDFDAQLSRIDAATTKLAEVHTVVVDLLAAAQDEIKAGGLKQEVEDSVLSKLGQAATALEGSVTKLEAIGKPEDPAGEETPDVEVPTEEPGTDTPTEEPTPDEPVVGEPGTGEPEPGDTAVV